jgi:hypothetical protein
MNLEGRLGGFAPQFLPKIINFIKISFGVAAPLYTIGHNNLSQREFFCFSKYWSEIFCAVSYNGIYIIYKI